MYFTLTPTQPPQLCMYHTLPFTHLNNTSFHILIHSLTHSLVAGGCGIVWESKYQVHYTPSSREGGGVCLNTNFSKLTPTTFHTHFTTKLSIHGGSVCVRVSLYTLVCYCLSSLKSLCCVVLCCVVLCCGLCVLIALLRLLFGNIAYFIVHQHFT